MDFGAIVTIVLIYAVIIVAAVWVTRVIIRAERNAAKKDIKDAIDNISKGIRN